MVATALSMSLGTAASGSPVAPAFSVVSSGSHPRVPASHAEFNQHLGTAGAAELSNGSGSVSTSTALAAVAAATAAVLGAVALPRRQRGHRFAKGNLCVSVTSAQQRQRSRCQLNAINSTLGTFTAPTAATVVPPELLEGKYGKECEILIDKLPDTMHLACITNLMMEELKDKAGIGLHGQAMEDKYFRNNGGTTIMNMSVMCQIGKVLMENFPDDDVYCDEDVNLMAEDTVFATLVADTLTDFGVVQSATAEDVAKWAAHCGTRAAKQAKGEGSSRYWVLNPVDNTQEMKASKAFGVNMTLVEDNVPVVTFMGCPVQAFDHHSRSNPHINGCPIHYAVKGQGAWTQLVMLNREVGVYTGDYRLKGRSLQMDCNKKVHRSNDMLYDVLGTEQLSIGMNSRLREDIFVDAERIAKILGSDYPKYDLTSSAIKYAWLAEGKSDIIWYFPRGLYDKEATESLAHHASGVLLCVEAGAICKDLDGQSIDWCGELLENNRGIVTCDVNKASMQGVLDAITESTSASEVAYEEREAKKLEVSTMLKNLFKTMAEQATGEEEIEGAGKVLEKGMAMLENDEEMGKVTQDSMNRDKPILGEGMVSDDPFGASADPFPMSPINKDP